MKNNKLENFISERVPVALIDETTGQALKKISASDCDEMQYVFVTDDHKVLKGYFEFHQLLKSKPDDKVVNLLKPCSSIGLNHSLEYVATHAISKNISSVPVTDENGIFVGIMPPQTIIETLRREHIEDIHKIAGIQKETAIAREAAEEAPVRSARHRLPWLLAGLAGSFISTFLMAGYEEMLHTYIMLSFFIPGIVYLADAVGTQTETIVIRGLSLSWGNVRKVLSNELWTGVLIGLVLGLLSIPVALYISHDVRIAVIVSSSILAASAVATSIGLIFPMLLFRFGIDPAFGSGPLATIIQDILSILIYLLMANLVLG